VSVEPTVLWDQPIRVHRGQPVYGVRKEQLRRAKILVEATGGSLPKGPTALAKRVAQLAHAVPGLCYSSGATVYRELAPEMVDLMSEGSVHRGPGAPLKWPDDRLKALAEMVARMKAESSRLSDKGALKRVRSGSIAFAKARAELAGLEFTSEMREEAAMPVVRTLQNYLTAGRRLTQNQPPA
jgi:hypothetical protein